MFQILEKNAAQPDVQADQNSPGFNYYKPIGEVAHTGVELEATGRVTRQLQINLGYAYLDPKITRDSDPTNVGRRELFLPKNTASLYTTYGIDAGMLRGFTFGGGVRFVAREPTSYDGSTKDIPGYTVVDATIGYAVAKWLVQLNAHNIFDRHYFISEYQLIADGNQIGDPANVTLSIRRRF